MSPFLARARELYQGLQSNREVLLNLFETNREAFKAKILEEVDALVVNDEEHIILLDELKQIRRHRSSGNEKDIVEQIKEIHKKYEELIFLDLNIPTEERQDELTRANIHVASFLTENGFDREKDSPEKALVLLGIEQIDEEDKITYRFPGEIMPLEVKTKWEKYLASVINHFTTSLDLRDGKASQAEVTEADKARTYAHDTVTKDVHFILGLEGIHGWKTSDTRKVLASIRECVLPTEASLQQPSSQALIDQYSALLRVSTLLSTRSS